jgi:predicted N-acetyltransferase YhbS
MTRPAHVAVARTSEQVSSARALAAEVFGPNAGLAAEAAGALKDFVWAEPGFPGPDHLIVALGDGAEVLGLTRLLPRSMRGAAGEEPIRVAGISSVCVAPAHRGSGLSRAIMEASLAQARVLGYEATLLFARRAVDHYYPRFGIWGIASYGRVVVRGFPEGGAPRYRARPVREADREDLAVWYATSYRDCPGALERSSRWWPFLLEKAVRHGLEVVVLEDDGERGGYAVLSGETIVEVAFGPGVRAPELLRAAQPDGSQVVLDVSVRHPLLEQLTELDVTISARTCAYGGHMMGILRPGRFVARLEGRIAARAAALGLSPRKEFVDRLALEWDGRRARVRAPEGADGGDLTLRETACLLGARLAAAPSHSVLAPGEPFDFLAVDGF